MQGKAIPSSRLTFGASRIVSVVGRQGGTGRQLCTRNGACRADQRFRCPRIQSQHQPSSVKSDCFAVSCGNAKRVADGALSRIQLELDVDAEPDSSRASPGLDGSHRGGEHAASHSTRLRHVSFNSLQDARAVQGRYGGSTLLVQQSVDHGSVNGPSVYSARLMLLRKHFEDGTLPEAGTRCGTNCCLLVAHTPIWEGLGR